jgi:hypothetical protein
MSDAPDITREPTLYITDAELIRRMGVPEKIARAALRQLDHQKGSGFPKKQALFGGRRYWPAVKAYLDRLNGVKMDASQRRAS